MKKLLFLLLLVGCEREQTDYFVKQGENIFKPVLPTLPMTGSTLEYDVKIGQEWWIGGMTEPEGYGCKLPAAGRLNYHNGGANFAISCTNCHVFISPRYYEPISDGTYKLHEIDAKTEMQPNVAVSCKIVFGDSTGFFINNKLVHLAPLKIPHDWICPAFLGRSGNDNNYEGGPLPGAWAARDFRLSIAFR